MKTVPGRCTSRTELTGKIMSVRGTGLTLCPSMPYLGASADGFITYITVSTLAVVVS